MQQPKPSTKKPPSKILGIASRAQAAGLFKTDRSSVQKKQVLPKPKMVQTESGKVISKAENDFRKKSSDAAMNAQFFSRPEYANKKKAEMFQKAADENWRKADSSREANKAAVMKFKAEMAMKKKK